MTKVTKENFGDLLLESAEQALKHSKKKTLNIDFDYEDGKYYYDFVVRGNYA